MKVKNLGLLILIGACILVIGSSMFGCGQGSSSTPTTTLPPAGSLTISGSINAGNLTQASINSAGVKIQAKAYAAMPSCVVTAVGKETGKLYFADSATDASGNFTISNLPSGEAFYLQIFDSNNELIAPIAMGTEGSNVVMAISGEGQATVNLGQITYDSTKDCAVPTAEPTAYLDLSTSVEVKSGETYVPKGAGNLGKGSVTEITSGYDISKADGDKDGLPNYVDADNNGDLIPDEFDGMYTKEALVMSKENFYPYVFTNLKVDYDNRNTYKQTYNTFTVAIGITENSKTNPSAKTITSVEVTSGPSWMASAKLINTSTYWSSIGYYVPLKQNGVYEVQLNNVSPETQVNAGDMLKFKVVFSDGTSEEAIKMINFVFTEIPSVTAYRIGSSGTWQTTLPVSGRLALATTSEVGIKWTRPKDENGNEIKGGRYTWEYNNSTGGASEYEVIASDSGSGTELDSTQNVLSFPDFKIPTGTSGADAEFMLGVCIRSGANDNSANNTRFQKAW